MTQPLRIEQALQACRQLQRSLLAAAEHDEDPDYRLQQLSARVERLQDLIRTRSLDYEQTGRNLMMTLSQQFPGLWQAVDRRLLWFFGGDCLHFLSEEEILAFQQAEEAAEEQDVP